jgi:hypothetical protein
VESYFCASISRDYFPLKNNELGSISVGEWQDVGNLTKGHTDFLPIK